MSSVASFCRICGRALETGAAVCPDCDLTHAAVSPLDPSVSKDPSYSAGSAGSWPPPYVQSAAQPEPRPSPLDLVWAFAVWGISGGFLIILDAAFRLYIWRTQGKPPEVQFTPLIVIVSLTLTMIFQLAGLGAAWMTVTRLGKRPFWRTLGWGWHPQFKWVHAVGLAILMLGVAVVLEKVLPHRETELEKLLKMGFFVRLMVAALAVVTAPLIEEIVYRGVIYMSVEGLAGTRLAFVVTAAMFAMVHLPQYWGSYAAIATIVLLSLVLTALRAWTGKLLPCVATHLVYNGIQAALLLAAPEKPVKSPSPAVIVPILQWLGWC